MEPSPSSIFSTFFEEADEIVQFKISATLRLTELSPNFGCACVVFQDDKQLFQSDSIWHSKTPKFQQKMSIIPTFAYQQNLTFYILEMTPHVQELSEYKRIGEVTIPLGQILVNDGVEATLIGGVGDVQIEVIQDYNGRGVISLVVAFAAMPKNHWLMKNYPRLHVCKYDRFSGRWTSIYKTNIIKRSETGQWDPFSLACRQLVGNDYSRKIRFLVEDVQDEAKPIEIGHVDVPLKSVANIRNVLLKLVPANPRQARAGEIIIRASTLVERQTFFGHIKNGLRFNFAVGIDFSVGNRPARDTKSLHYTSIGKKNCYESCIDSIGNTIEPYSLEKKFRAWGFGAKFNRMLCQVIPLIQGDQESVGTKEILNAYWRIFEHLQFDHPICVCPSTNKALELIGEKTDLSKYLVFLLLIQEDPTDLDDFVDLLYAHQYDPLTVIIIGIGDNDFPLTSEKFPTGKAPRNSKTGDEFDRDFTIFLRYKDYGNEGLNQLTTHACQKIPQQASHWIELH